ncbi:FkbM family methyltransferase [Methylophilus glucosoxydans]|uniref:FkbM family methyltransferase n=1 Tax=Methylophilus glucosoxydans TaxID=752553 RepID=A0ABW3GJF8_9PROT
MPLISVCIPAYRQSDILLRTVRSVLSQKNCNFEVVITDDTEDTSVKNALGELLEDSRLRYIKNPSRLGAINNWNACINYAAGSVIKILHHDDWFEDEYSLFKSTEPILSGKCLVVFTACFARNIYGKKLFLHQAKISEIEKIKLNPERLVFANLIGPPSVVAFSKILDVRFNAGYTWLSDIDFYIRLMNTAKGNFNYLEAPLINVTADSIEQLSRDCEKNKLRSLKENISIFSEYKVKRPRGEILRHFGPISYGLSLKELSLALIFSLKSNQTIIAISIFNGFIKQKIYGIKMSLVKYLLALKGKVISLKSEMTEKKNSYSQSGEDLIVNFLIEWMGLSEVSYLDLGANDPIHLNNTYFFYKKGYRGVLVEPDLFLANQLKKVRPNDVCEISAVGINDDPEVTFYKMSSNTLSTTQSSTVKLYESNSDHKLADEVKVKQIHINALLKKYFPLSSPTFVSLDVEGMDLSIIKSWDFNKWRPSIFCIETLTYSQNKTAEKISEIFEFMKLNGYIKYADTYINTIFVNRQDWDKRSG